MGSGGADGGPERLDLEVAGVRRGYWLARGPQPPGALLIMLHGSGTTGRDVATIFTGLAGRGPAAGVTVAFPDGWRGVWHIARPPAGEPAPDDAAFLGALARRLAGRSADDRPVFLAGLSNGAGFAEHVARHGLLRLDGLFLVAGTLREFSRQAVPVPRQRLAVTIMAGTADPMARYEGGPMRAPGIAGWILRRRAARHGDLPAERRVVAVETVARDWAAGNGIGGEPAAERLPQAPGDPPVTRLTWSAPGCLPVVLYRVEGGGHGWPGGPQYLPARIVGPIPCHLDATGILLEQVTANQDFPSPGVSGDKQPPSALEIRVTAI
jgi:polyhydroxybutyrate depolymerase